MVDIYTQYGVPSEWAKGYVSQGISSSVFRKTPKTQLVKNYQIPQSQVDFVKNCLKRKAIDKDVVQHLLERSGFACCLCQGRKGDGYVIHHINAYSTSQDNSYSNLVVLCPNDHDLVHREGQSLTNKISAEQLIRAKRSWEKEVEDHKVKVASDKVDLNEVDFLNVPRILDLYVELLEGSPSTNYSKHLASIGAITADGSINYDFIRSVSNKPSTPFIFFGPNGSWELSLHYTEVFKELMKRIEFKDLDHLLSKRSLKNQRVIGEFCFYVGGVYGNRPEHPITDDTPPVTLYFHRKKFFVEWIVDPKFMISSSSIVRLSDRTLYIIYGRIRSVGIKEWKGKEYINFVIRPYLFGLPNQTKSRTPLIHYQREFEDFDFDD